MNAQSNNRNRTAIFLDRDGTLIEDVGFLSDVKGIKVFPDTIGALQKLQKNHLLFVVTNQCGVDDGLLTMDDVRRINAELAKILSEQNIRIQEWYVCPHGKHRNCSCRKPQTAFLEQAVASYGIDLSGSYAIGDHPHDATYGASLGVRGVYLLTGHGRRHRGELPAGKPVFQTIGEAAEWIAP